MKNAKPIATKEYSFEETLKALHKFYGRTDLMKIIGSIAKNHKVIELKGKGNISNRTYAIGIQSSYYKSLIRDSVDSNLAGRNLHACKLFKSDGANAYNLIFNKFVYKDIEEQLSRFRKALGI